MELDLTQANAAAYALDLPAYILERTIEPDTDYEEEEIVRVPLRVDEELDVDPIADELISAERRVRTAMERLE